MSNEINASEAEKKLMEQQISKWGKIIFIRKNNYTGTIENTENGSGDIAKINQLLSEGWRLKPISPE